MEKEKGQERQKIEGVRGILPPAAVICSLEDMGLLWGRTTPLKQR